MQKRESRARPRARPRLAPRRRWAEAQQWRARHTGCGIAGGERGMAESTGQPPVRPLSQQSPALPISEGERADAVLVPANSAAPLTKSRSSTCSSQSLMNAAWLTSTNVWASQEVFCILRQKGLQRPGVSKKRLGLRSSLCRLDRSLKKATVEVSDRFEASSSVVPGGTTNG